MCVHDYGRHQARRWILKPFQNDGHLNNDISYTTNYFLKILVQEKSGKN